MNASRRPNKERHGDLVEFETNPRHRLRLDSVQQIKVALKMTITVDLNASSSDTHARRTLTEISLLVAKAKKVVVVTGAGISCSCGIPDFRSSDGLYALVKQKYPDVVLKGRDLFDASLFRDATSTSVFYTFISQLKRSIDSATPTPTHHFIKTLDNKKKLLRSYTQNIDGLEARVGLLGTSCQEAQSSGKGKNKIRTKDVRNVQLHGDIHRVRCMSCSAQYPCTEDHLNVFNVGNAPDCPECLFRSEARAARSARPIRVGSLRPAIVLYDESHPLGDDIGAIQCADVSRKPDLLIIMGTSLRVHGLKKLVKEFARAIHSSTSSAYGSSKRPRKVIFVNKTSPGSEWTDIIDYHVAGETDSWVKKVLEDWKKARPADWEIQQTLVVGDGDLSIDGGFKTIKHRVQKKGGNKKTFTESENIVPVTTDSIPSAPVVAPTPKIPAMPPLSPSKRRQAESHYCELNASPSKRRVADVQKGVLPSTERRMLFTESTNTPVHVPLIDPFAQADLDDKSMLDVESLEKPNAGPKATKAKPRNTAPKKTDVKLRATLRKETSVRQIAPRTKRKVVIASAR